MSTAHAVFGTNGKAPFILKVHRGDGMALLAMDWKNGKPPRDFVGFGIESKAPGSTKFYPINNRLDFDNPPSRTTLDRTGSLVAPIQYFRWVHFPRDADKKGAFTYRVTPVFMDANDVLTYGETQEARIELARETYPGVLNISFTRGFVASQAFVDRYCQEPDDIKALLPQKADTGLDFVPTHKKAKEALAWMGFEARSEVLGLLDEAIADTSAKVFVVAYDLNQPEILQRLEKLKGRLRIIIDDSTATDKNGKVTGHGTAHSAESNAAKRLRNTAGTANVKRGHVGGLQHNKTIAVTGKVNKVVLGSTNFTWRGLYVQNNHAVVLHGKKPVKICTDAFEEYWRTASLAAPASAYAKTVSSGWQDLQLPGIDASITFSPRTAKNSVVPALATDILRTKSSLFYSLAFLYQTPGKVREALEKMQKANKVFSLGISDRDVKVLELKGPSGLVRLVHPEALAGAVPKPFKPEPTGGGGNRMHHKFMVADFDSPDARVYLGSFNFSVAADNKNGENLLLIKDRRIATSFMIEAVRIYDHYAYRVARKAAKTRGGSLNLQRPPMTGKKPWWDKYYTNPYKVRDRELFSRK